MEKLIDAFCRWEPLGQAIFIIIILGGLCTFVTTLVRGYPNIPDSK